MLGEGERAPVQTRKETPDVAVVGACAAGLAAARAAAAEGADVLLLEARETLGVPAPPAALAFDFLWSASFRPPPEVVRRRHGGVRLRSPGGYALDVDAALSILDRARFDRWLAAEAASRGARVLTGVRGLRALPDRTLAAEGLEVRARVALFADGVGSLSRAFLQPLKDPDHLAWGAILELDLPGGVEPEDRVGITLGSHARGGRSQLNPLEGARCSHWTFFRGSPRDAEDAARRALALDARLRGWPAGVEKEARYVGVAPDPVYALPGRLVADGVMVAGGAGGQGGLEAGLAAGELAGRLAARAARAGATDAHALGAYERQWKRENLSGYETLRFVTDALARLSDHDLDEALRPWQGRTLPAAELAGLADRSPLRRAQAAWRALSDNPAALPALARAGVRALRR